MDINLSPKDRARILGAASEQINDPVALIQKKALQYDQCKELIKSSFKKFANADTDNIDLLAMVKAMLIVLKGAEQKILQLQQDHE